MLSLVKQSTLEPPSESTAKSHNIKQSKKHPKTQSVISLSLFQTKIQQKLYSTNMCAFTETIQCHVYKSVFFPPANLSAFCNLPPLPAWIHTDELVFTVLYGTSSIFSRNDITAVPVSQLLLWDIFHILAMPS